MKNLSRILSASLLFLTTLLYVRTLEQQDFPDGNARRQSAGPYETRRSEDASNRT